MVAEPRETSTSAVLLSGTHWSNTRAAGRQQPAPRLRPPRARENDRAVDANRHVHVHARIGGRQRLARAVDGGRVPGCTAAFFDRTLGFAETFHAENRIRRVQRDEEVRFLQPLLAPRRAPVPMSSSKTSSTSSPTSSGTRTSTWMPVAGMGGLLLGDGPAPLSMLPSALRERPSPTGSVFLDPSPSP